jgi:anhydro-N-acetylmuramic acid kinase
LYSIGLMSGTSMDGIDAALLKTNGEDSIFELGNIKLLYTEETKYLLKSAERAIKNASGDLQLAKLNYLEELNTYLIVELHIDKSTIVSRVKSLTTYLQAKTQTKGSLSLDGIIYLSTLLHAKAVELLLSNTKKKASEIDLIGYHGQTMYHSASEKLSLQIGDGALLANITGITVVNDFRSRDIAAGGQGAPFAPVYHLALARRDNKIPLAVINCGGIANISLITDSNIESLIGFDSGPGNGLIDALIRQRSHGSLAMDFNGQYGKLGVVNQNVLQALFEKTILMNDDNYYLKNVPKSLDIRDMKLISELDNLSLQDACRTLEAFTADMIVKSLDLVPVDIPRYWILAGGGWHNPIIKERLVSQLLAKYGSDMTVATADEAGWNGEAMEAQIFSYLAVRSIKDLPLSVPGTTNVPMPISGGVVHYPASEIKQHF